jgi:hypothetical protein
MFVQAKQNLENPIVVVTAYKHSNINELVS